MTQILNASDEILKDVLDYYEQSQQTSKFHGIIIGDKSVGKTTSLGTMPHPVFIMSFNPSGTIVLKDLIKEGKVVVDARYEKDSIDEPTAFINFWNNLGKMKRSGFLDRFASFAIDGLSEMGHCLVWFLCKRESRMYPTFDSVIKTNKEKHGPSFNEWDRVLNTMLTLTREVQALPMHTAITAHVERDKDETLQSYVKFLMFPGQAKAKIPILVPEIYYLLTRVNASANRVERYFLTQNDGDYQAGTKLGYGGKLAKEEAVDIKAILKKCGCDYADKPLIKV